MWFVFNIWFHSGLQSQMHILNSNSETLDLFLQIEAVTNHSQSAFCQKYIVAYIY